VLAYKQGDTALDPTRTLSEMKFTITPCLGSHAMKASALDNQRRLMQPAPKIVKRSPPARSPSDAPTSTEIADVTVTAVCRELQNNQKQVRKRDRHEPCFRGTLATKHLRPGGI